jgi:hypothetical protein
MWGGAVTTGGFSEPPGWIVYVAGRRASVGGGAVLLGVVALVLAVPVVGLGGGGVDVVVVAVGGELSGAVGGAPVAVRRDSWLVPDRAAVDVPLPDPDPPHPAAVNSRAAPKRTANRLTFAG